MHSFGHSDVRRPAGPRSRSLTVLQTQGLHPALGRGHLSEARSDLCRTHGAEQSEEPHSTVPEPVGPPELRHQGALWRA